MHNMKSDFAYGSKCNASSDSCNIRQGRGFFFLFFKNMVLKLVKKLGQGVIMSRQISPFHVTTAKCTIIIDTLLRTEVNQVLLCRGSC